MKIVITGATGFIGPPLVSALRARGDDVIALVRDAARAKQHLPEGQGLTIVQADIESTGAWTAHLDGADAVLHLAGEPVAGKRWDARQKQRLRDSRIESTRVLVEAIGQATKKPRALITASGVDYYAFANSDNDFDDDEFTESAPAAETFLGRLCRDWEHEAHVAEKLGVRVACMRTGIVLGRHGGALEQMRRPFQLFAGGRIGHGRQWIAWIHVDDVVDAYLAATTDERYRGPINLVTDSARNADFAKQLGKAMHRPSWLPVPALAVKAAVGSEFAQSLLEGRRVVPAKLRELGFAWKHPSLPDALASSV